MQDRLKRAPDHRCCRVKPGFSSNASFAAAVLCVVLSAAARSALTGRLASRWRLLKSGASLVPVLERRMLVLLCAGRDRSRLIQLYLMQNVFSQSKQCALLNVAPEYGLYRWLKADHLEWITLHAICSRKPIPTSQTWLRRICLSLPFETDAFDVILCSARFGAYT